MFISISEFIKLRGSVMMILVFSFDSARERDAFEYIYDHYKQGMLNRANSILRNMTLAEDAVSEAFIRIYKNIGKIGDPSSNQSAAFVMTVVKNTALTLLNRESSQQAAPLEENYSDPVNLEGLVLDEIASEHIYKIVDGIGEELRSVFLLRYAYDLPHKKIGELLSISENNVTVRLHRAKKQIAVLLEKEGYCRER
jgi:RNA polymerase sigma-70 factor (ECF subfamily)